LCAIDDIKRTGVSPRKLLSFDGDWNRLLQLALYTQLAPWNKKRDGLEQWFIGIEQAIVELENWDSANDAATSR
jgi:hypothetical protein